MLQSQQHEPSGGFGVQHPANQFAVMQGQCVVDADVNWDPASRVDEFDDRDLRMADDRDITHAVMVQCPTYSPQYLLGRLATAQVRQMQAQIEVRSLQGESSDRGTEGLEGSIRRDSTDDPPEVAREAIPTSPLFTSSWFVHGQSIECLRQCDRERFESCGVSGGQHSCAAPSGDPRIELGEGLLGELSHSSSLPAFRSVRGMWMEMEAPSRTCDLSPMSSSSDSIPALIRLFHRSTEAMLSSRASRARDLARS